MLEVTPEVAQAIGRDESIDEIDAAASAAGLVTFREEAHRRARAGRISLEEVAQVTAEF